MATFFFTDKLLQKLNEDLFQKSSSDFDSGIEKSITNKAWGTGIGINDFLKRLFGDNGTPDKLVSSMTKAMHVDNDIGRISNILFKDIKTVPVFLPHILITNKTQRQEIDSDSEDLNVRVESHNFYNNYTYEILNEASLHKIGKNFFQAMDSSHRVFFTYKGQLATVEPNKTFNSFLSTSGTMIGHGPLHQYVISNLDKISGLVKNDLLSKLDNPIDKAVVNEIIRSGYLPILLQNSTAAGILDMANIGIQTSPKSFTPTANSIAGSCLNNKDTIIASDIQLHKTGFSDLPPELKSDLRNKIISSEHLAAEVYKKDGSLQLFLNSYELGKKNPHSTYRKVYKMCLAVFNWMVNDLNKSVFKSQTKQSELYFSSPSLSDINRSLGASPKKDAMPFVVIKAVGSEESEFPVEYRCFATEASKTKDASYSSISGVTKACVITPGFNSYIANKAKEELGNSDVNSYIKQLDSIQPGESSAHMSFTEGAKIMIEAIKQSYIGEGRFKSKLLFKYVPDILSQDEKAGLSIYTSMKDLSNVNLPFTNRLSNRDDNFSVSKTAKHAAMLLVNPIDPNTGSVSGIIPQVDLFSSEANQIQETFIRDNEFIPLSSIRELFLSKLDDVTSLNELLELSNEFSPVIKNLSRGFWTARGAFKLSDQFNDGKSLGLFNILKGDAFSSDEKTMELGVVGGNLNIKSLGISFSKDTTGKISVKDTGDSRLFIDARMQATDNAVRTIATFIGGR